MRAIRPIRLAERKVEDPVRFPKVIVPLENSVKRIYKAEINKTMIELTKKMTDFVKNNG